VTTGRRILHPTGDSENGRLNARSPAMCSRLACAAIHGFIFDLQFDVDGESLGL
jgi:hypothetical protein